MNKLFMKEAVCPRLLLVDGLSRAGKMLAAKLISNFERVEYFQSYEPIEDTPILWRAGILDDDNAKALLRLQLDTVIYNRAFGRNLNLRLSDSSSVHLAANYAEYARRAIEPNSDDVIKRYNDEGWVPFYMTHEVMPNIALYFSTVEDLRVIEVVRHPVDLAFSWNRRGWGERWGTDPLALIPTLKHGDRAVPWFAAEFADNYLALQPMDRVIRSILALKELCDAGFEGSSAKQKARIHFLTYESLMTAPSREIEKLESFLGVAPLDGMPGILAREGLPGGPVTITVSEKLSFIREKATPELVEDLLDAGHEYEAAWNLDPLTP